MNVISITWMKCHIYRKQVCLDRPQGFFCALSLSAEFIWLQAMPILCEHIFTASKPVCTCMTVGYEPAEWLHDEA